MTWIVIGSVAPWLLGSAATAAGFRLVVKTGDPAPISGAGATLSQLSGAEINAQGDVLYSALIKGPTVATSNNTMLGVARANGTNRVVARTGWVLPTAPEGSKFTGFETMMINEAGNVAFASTMDPPATEPSSYDAVWMESGGLKLVDSAKINGNISGSYYGDKLRIEDMDRSGRVLYTKYHSSFSGSVLTADDYVWWLAAQGKVNREIVAQGSSQLISPGQSVKYSYIFESPTLANNGRVIFAAQLTGSGIDTTNNDTVWVDDNSNKQILYRDGQVAPGLPSGVVFTQVRDSFSQATGQIAFKATIGGPGVDETNSKALFSNAGGTLHLVARMGQSLPGGGTLGDSNYFQEIAGASTGFYSSFTDAEGGYGQAFFAERNGTLRTVVRNGQPAPGFAGYTLSISTLESMRAVPGSDRFAVLSDVRRGVSEYSTGVWVENESFSLVPVLLGGTQIQFGTATKTVNSLRMGEFSSSGELPLTVFFTDETSAVLIWDGKLSSLALAGDYNSDGRVDAADYTVWRDTRGTRGDFRANGDNMGASAGAVDQADFLFWRSHLGDVRSLAFGVGDYNSNGRVDAADYTVWRDTRGSTSDLRANGDNAGASAGAVDQADFSLWKSHFGANQGAGSAAIAVAPVPEPMSLSLLLALLATLCGMVRYR